MVSFLKNRAYSTLPVLRRVAKCCPIGVDIGDDTIKMVQLSNNNSGKDVSLIAADSKNQPEELKTGSGNWQRWTIEAMHQMTANGKFRGREVIAAMPAAEVFIDHVRMRRMRDGEATEEKLQDAIFSRIKQKLPFEPDDAMIKYIPAEDNNVVVIAAERKIIDRHLAIYENANLKIKSIGIWPVALVNSYTAFFARRKADIEAVVMLLEIDACHTNAVACRYRNLLFARSIPIGANQLENGEMMARLVLELNACRRHFGSMYKNVPIERLIFLTSQSKSTNMCGTIAKQLEMPAQTGDCLAAVKVAKPDRLGVDRRDSQVNWATAFGLSLS
ncbi:MAG TPA: pilus assembly protein PilM [Sedimentisphaerales bacterium]|nr:pilus assembly protein PilM [Sedimentisphaerales bacterium]